MTPRKSLGMFTQIHTLKTCPLYRMYPDGMLFTSVDSLCRKIRSNERLKYPVALFQPDIRDKNAQRMLQIVAESYAQIQERHGAFFMLTTRPDIEDYLSSKHKKEKALHLPYPIYYLRQGGIADLVTTGFIRPDQRHLFLLTPRGDVLKHKTCAMNEELVSDASDLMRWSSMHGSHAPDAETALLYRRRS